MLRRQDMGQMKNTQYDIMMMEMDIFLVASHHYKADTTGSENTQKNSLMGSICFLYAVF